MLLRSWVDSPTSVRGSSQPNAVGQPLEIALFGTLAARSGNESIPLRLPDQAIRLLAYLLLTRSRIAPREHVAFTLWPDADEADARANLRRKLHLIRGALPAGPQPWVLTTSTSVGWNCAAPYRLDVEAFESLSRADAPGEADALYCGALLTGFDDDWVVRERDRLQSIALDNLLTLMTRAQKRRDYTAAIRFGQRLRAIDPWREDALRALVTVRYEAGDRAGALGEYERFRSSLMAELGVEPMPETICVFESVRTNAAAPAGSIAIAAAAAPRPLHELPFVGREREVDAATAAWNMATSGNGGALLITGEAGIGKTRLIDEFATFVAANGGRVLRGGSTPFELAPYQPISEALRGALPLLREAALAPLWLAVLATLVPQITGAFRELPQLMQLDSEAQRARLFEAVDTALKAVSAVRPALLVLEDMHWAGSTTTALFEHLTRAATQHRLLIVASYREEELGRTHPLRMVRRRLERERLLRAVALGPLDRDAVEGLVGQIADIAAAERAAIANTLRASTDGNPFFLGEVIANDRELGFLDGPGRRWQRSDGPAPSLATALISRLARLSARARSVAEIAAVIGRSFSAELVREVSGVDERSTLEGIDELIDRRLVRDVDAASSDFAFSHQLIVHTIYTAMSPEARRRRHRRIGNVIEELYGDTLEELAAELAVHFDRGGEADHAAQYYALAARLALSVFGTGEAQALAERGAELAADAVTRFRCIEILEEAALRLGDRAAQRAHVDALLVCAAQIADAEVEREALRRHIVLAHDCGERDAERDAIERLEARLAGAAPVWQAAFAQLKGSYLTAIGAYELARETLAGALAGVSSADHPRIYVECRCALVELAGFEGRVADVHAFLAELPAFERAFDPARAVTLLEAACAAASTIQDYPALAASAGRLLEISRTIGYREGEASACTYAGRAALRMFDIDRARSLLERALETFAALGQRLKQLRALNEIGNLATTIGRFDEAIAHFTRADEIAASITYPFGQAGFANNISYAAYLKGDFALARSAAQRALTAAESIAAPSARAHALISCGVAERELGNTAAAIARLEEGTDIERRLNETIALGEDLCELIVVLLRAGARDRAAELVPEILALAAGTTQHPQRLFWTVAAVHHADGDEAQARAFLSRARTLLDEREAAIPDAESRASFRALRHNRAIDDAFDRGRWEI